MCVVHGNKKEEVIIFPHCLYIFFVSKDKKIKTKKEKKIYGKKGQLEYRGEKRITTSVDTETTTNEKIFENKNGARVREKK
jgi:hypothetical protein